MRNIYPSLLNTLLTLAEKFSLPINDQKTAAVPDVQSEASDEIALDKELAPYEVTINDFGAPRWLCRSHYRSIFPHMF